MRTVDFQDGYGQKVRVQLSSGHEVRIYIEGKAMVGVGEEPPEVKLGLLLPPAEARILVCGIESMLRELED